ncbi:23S rRNA (guanosine(2251)-2'-O)-methyltransferase RlmB [Candidatus Synechococcus calcipolaris G9]|uniref:23S rRNA (Guanosine(2251)-2'-O)-methyltransferase RlmB n=1 Tax=Candidatus Synechococcus calcipolaris G9 TaxID=1497997 RepID=A0ABT6EWE3_9SYNE|nr:23S rRNA (guanosine(2251)-2'-O)-methyltransferase RlmB [Candidatus Synechococcus calcipolaris]MDG2989692.1 23S rRNA (guanosine(2251)-2'-O)-methyltransferase RlmB [Candidatus Synechococcus calcipolaris G9]
MPPRPPRPGIRKDGRKDFRRSDRPNRDGPRDKPSRPIKTNSRAASPGPAPIKRQGPDAPKRSDRPERNPRDSSGDRENRDYRDRTYRGDRPGRSDQRPPRSTTDESTNPDLIYGRHTVLTAIESGRPCNRIWVIEALRYDPRFLSALNHAKAEGAVIDVVPSQRLDHLCQRGRHQGIAAQVAAHPYLEMNELINQAAKVSQNPILLAADGINDPHNLGAIIRSAEALGVQGLIIPQRRAVGVTATVAKVASGAIDHLPVARVINFNQGLETLKAAGYWIYGLAPGGSDSLTQTTFEGPIVLVVGSEESGLGLQTQKHCDHILSIPLPGRTNSLNASVAAGIALYEVCRQRPVAVRLNFDPPDTATTID